MMSHALAMSSTTDTSLVTNDTVNHEFAMTGPVGHAPMETTNARTRDHSKSQRSTRACPLDTSRADDKPGDTCQAKTMTVCQMRGLYLS